MDTLQPGALLQGGRYKILHVLGQGSFGITYLAERTSLHQKVCIKEFFMKDINTRGADGSLSGVSESSLSVKYAKKFRQEAQNLSSLSHPNIVEVTDLFDENGTCYYVMKYIEGEDLNSYVKHHSCTEAEAVSIIKDIASALHYMHEEKQMLHLDLKPGNVMRRSSDGHIFVIDFGLSKYYNEDGEPETSTIIGLGTNGYAPLEQSNQSKSGEFRPTIDVYALGATLFKLLTGETPSESYQLIKQTAKQQKLVGPLQKCNVSQSLIDAITQAMMFDSTERTQSVAEFMASLSVVQEETVSDESTIINQTSPDEEETIKIPEVTPVAKKPIIITKSEQPPKSNKKWLLIAAVCIVIIGVVVGFNIKSTSNTSEQVAPSDPQEISSQTITANGVSFDMMLVKSGTFTMGDDNDEYAKPAHEVTLTKDYYIGKTEVTQALWQAVMGSNPSGYKGDNLPVECVSWDDCQKFIKNLNELTGKNFRLPTEAEWEFAARGGNNSNHYQYSGSNNLDEVAWYDSNSGSKTHKVGQKSPNELGIFDMSGNVWEWCSDWYGDYSSGAQTDPKGPNSEQWPVYRGGCWSDNAEFCRSSNRYNDGPDGVGNFLGLRLCLCLSE